MIETLNDLISISVMMILVGYSLIIFFRYGTKFRGSANQKKISQAFFNYDNNEDE